MAGFFSDNPPPTQVGSEDAAESTIQEDAVTQGDTSSGFFQGSPDQTTTDAYTADALAAKIAAEAAKSAAELAETNAEAAKSAAETAETNAETAETNAETAETNAETAETNAAGSATSATNSASTATTKASESAASASTASTASTSATNSSNTATTKAAEASTSASNAASSETAAGNSAATSATQAQNSSASAASSLASKNASEAAKTAAETAETNAETAETNAAGSATAAAGSATAATNSSSTASAQASASATQASSSASSATASSNSATSAATAQNAAEAARDSALAALDSFDDRYLGSKSSAPTVDNDGNALVSGALYFDSTATAMKVWDGSNWLNAYASLSGALIANNNLSDLNNAVTARSNLGIGNISNAGINVTGAITASGEITANGGISLVDNKKLTFGTGDDLEVYHDGYNSYINDVGTGNIFIRGANVVLTTAGGTKYLEGGSNVLRLYHTGNQRMQTSAAGISVTGTVTATGTSVFDALDISGDIDVDGTITAGNLQIPGVGMGGSNQYPLDLGSSAATQLVLQRWQTSAGTGKTYIVAYGAQHASEAGNFAIKNVLANRDIYFQLAGSVVPLRLTSTGAIFAGEITANGGNSANWNTAFGWGNHASQSYATETYVGTQISNLVDSSPAALNTLNELAAAIGDDANFSTTVTNNIATKLPLTGGTLTGNLGVSGNILAGTATAAYAQTGWADNVVAGNPTGNGGFTAVSDPNGYGTFYFSNGSATAAEKYAGHILYNHAADTMVLGAASTGVATISSAGLEVVGTIRQSTAPATYAHANADDLVLGTTVDGTSGMTIVSGTSGYGNVFFSNGTTGTTQYDGYIQYVHSTDTLGFGTAGAARMSLNTTGLNVVGDVKASGAFTRTAYNSGYLEGGYNNIGASSTDTGPIYTIGSNYQPAATTLGNMHGIGYTHTNASFINFTGASGWGQYVASDGDARIWLGAQNGVISSTGEHYVGANKVWHAGDAVVATSLTAGAKTIAGNLTVGNTTNSNIYMQDTDEGYRTIHCNSNRIGFLNSSGSWSAYSRDSGVWSCDQGLNVTGAVTSNNIVTSTGAYATSTVTFSSLNNPKSGFYDGLNGGTPTATWYSLVAMAHSGGNHGHQIAGSFYSAGDIYNRNNNNTSLSAWAKIYNTSNDGSGSGLDADTVDGVQASALCGKAGFTMQGLMIGRIATNTTVASNNDGGSMSIRGNTTKPAVVSFHRGGAYAINFGLSTANKMEMGGWSAGGIKHTWDFAGNYTAVAGIFAYSDIRVKENIEVIPEALDKVCQLSGYTFDRTDFVPDVETGVMPETRQTGVIAQEVLKVLPEAVTEMDDGRLTVAYGNMVGLLIESIKELKAEIDTLKAQIGK